MKRYGGIGDDNSTNGSLYGAGVDGVMNDDGPISTPITSADVKLAMKLLKTINMHENVQ
jgi:hypothetical protein